MCSSSTCHSPHPILLHLCLFPDATTPPVLDPLQLEQRLSAGLVSIALNAQKEICVLQKLGGVPLGTDDILRLVEVAVGKAKEMNILVEAKLQEDWAGRKVEVR
jgi:exosome complex component RRP45